MTAKFKQQALSGEKTPAATGSKDLSSVARWSGYLHHRSFSASASRKFTSSDFPSSSEPQKALNLEPVLQLAEVANGLLAKIYRLQQLLDYPDTASLIFTESFWRAGIIPNSPRICILLAKRFPEHPSNLQLERVDKSGMADLVDKSEEYLHSLEPWMMLLLDLMAFREQALKAILDLSCGAITLLPHQNALILHAFMDLFTSFVRVSLFSEKMPRKMLLQVYNLLHISRDGRDCEFYHRLVQFVDSYDPPVIGLQEDLNFICSRIGEILEAIGPTIFLSADTKKLRSEGFLSPFHPRYPDILTNLAHPMRAQYLANIASYREWVMFGYLVCPAELLRATSIDIAMAVLKENLVVSLFKDEHILLHEYYQIYVMPRILDTKKKAKYVRSKTKEADVTYNSAKQAEKMMSEAHDQAVLSCGDIHHERRVLLQQEVSRMVTFFTDQPTLLAPNIQMVFSALALAQCEVLWYFQHIGVEIAKSKALHLVPVNIDAADSTIGFILDGINRISSLIRRYASATKGYALSYLSSASGRIKFLLGTPGIVALDLDDSLRGLFHQIVCCLENVPKPHGGTVSSVAYDMSKLREDWCSVLLIVTSSRSTINLKHLEKATVSTGKEGLLSEGNNAYYWSRCFDQLEGQVLKYGSLHELYFYRHHLTTVFRNTLFGQDGHPQHCCAWIGIGSSFSYCASPIIPEEFTKIGRDSILYVESLIESISGGLEGLISILDSEGGFGSLELQLLPEQAAMHLNQASKSAAFSAKSPRPIWSHQFPGHESYPGNDNSLRMLEAAMERLTNLCSILNDMEPICVLNHVFVLREYMRETILGNFKKRLFAVLSSDNGIQRPSVIESLIKRHLGIVYLAEQHISMDLAQGIRDILLMEAYTGPVSSLQSFRNQDGKESGSSIEVVCNWYLDHIIKDSKGAGVFFSPAHNCFQSVRPVGEGHAESFTDAREMKAFIHIFGLYGLDKFNRMLREHAAALLNCIDTTLKSNSDALEGIASSLHSIEQRDASLKQLVDMETAVGFCIQVGSTLELVQILAAAANTVLEENAPLMHSLFEVIATHLPNKLPENEDIKRLKQVMSNFGVSREHDVQWVRSVIFAIDGARDDSWNFLPHLFAAFMTSKIWNSSTFNVNVGGFDCNIHCLARCINAVIGGSVVARLEWEVQKKVSPIDSSDLRRSDPAAENVSSEFAVKSAIELYVKTSARIIFDSSSGISRSQVAPKLIVLDQLCELSTYLSRSTLEIYVPYAILRSMYRQYYGKLHSLSFQLPNLLPQRSVPYSRLSMPSPILRSSHGGSTPHSEYADSNLNGGELARGVGSGTPGVKLNNLRSLRGSGPLEYSKVRKAKVEGSNSGSTGPSPLPRFAVSRSGPLPQKKNNMAG